MLHAPKPSWVSLRGNILCRDSRSTHNKCCLLLFFASDWYLVCFPLPNSTSSLTRQRTTLIKISFLDLVSFPNKVSNTLIRRFCLHISVWEIYPVCFSLSPAAESGICLALLRILKPSLHIATKGYLLHYDKNMQSPEKTLANHQ